MGARVLGSLVGHAHSSTTGFLLVKKRSLQTWQFVNAPSLENSQGQAGRGSEQPELVEPVPAHGRGGGEMVFKGPFQPKPPRDL